MAISQQDFQIKPGESITAYNARIDALRTQAGIPTVTKALATATPDVRAKAGLPSMSSTGTQGLQSQPSSLVNFSQAMEDLLQQTKQNRASALLGVANSGAIPTGALDAGSFSQLLGVAAQSSTDFVKGSVDLYKSLQPPAPPTPTGDIGQYQQALQFGLIPQGTSYYDFLAQSSAATRAPQVAGVGLDNLTTKQQAAFNKIVSSYDKSPLIAAADRGITLKNSINQVKNNPGDGPTQLNLIYGYIQALDQYQSAVREGEIGLSQGLVSYAGTLQNYLARVQQGRPLDKKTALAMANGATQLIDTINNGAKMKEKQFASQAKVNGIEDAWDSYITGFSASYNTGTSGEQKGLSGQTSSGIKYKVLP